MSFNTVPSSSSQNPTDVITIGNEKEFVIRELFSGNVENFIKYNPFITIYEDSQDTMIPLTSIIYTPNKSFFEKSNFFRQIATKNIMTFLKKNNILVIIYGITCMLDTNNTYKDSIIESDTILTNKGCIASNQICIPDIFIEDINIDDDNINLTRFENSSFNHKIATINERIKNLYGCNFSKINYLIFNDLNNDACINKFLKNVINISLI